MQDPASISSRFCYIDMDGFFASAEQHLRPELRGHPVGVHAGVPTQRHGVFISVSREAKASGIKSGMRSREAKHLLPSLQVLAQRPVEYIRLHHALVACIEHVIPVREVHSVDEVSIEVPMLWLLYGRIADQLGNEIDPTTGAPVPTSAAPYSVLDFWRSGVGVVTPHRAQQGLIVARLQAAFNATGQIADAIRDAVDTVERFQGQQRDVIVASYTLGDPDQIAEEDEFLVSLNRFNVIASRARAKLVVLISQDILSHLARELDVLWESRLLKAYAESFCNQTRPMQLPYLTGGTTTSVSGSFRWRA